MSAPYVRTRTPGIYKRGSRYVVTYRHNGKLRRETTRTLDEARRLKAARKAEVDRGEFAPRSRITLREYMQDWVERYQGNGRTGFRESTRDDYRSYMRLWIFEGQDADGQPRGYFSDRLRLADVATHDIQRFVDWLASQRGTNGRLLADSTVRNILNPLRACFGSAVREGLVRHNPTSGTALPHRPRIEDDDADEVRPLTREQLEVFLGVVPERHRLMFSVLAATGLRVGEMLALQWRHVRLDGSRPAVRVRRALSKGRIEPPKSRHGRRDVPLDHALVLALRRWRAETEWPREEDLVFPTRNGTAQSDSNLRRRVLKPTAEEACAPWAGFHTFRHTFASLHMARGTNVVQLSRLLGHHSAAFTLSSYVHLIDGDVGEPLSLGSELGSAALVAEDAAA